MFGFVTDTTCKRLDICLWQYVCVKTNVASPILSPQLKDIRSRTSFPSLSLNSLSIFNLSFHFGSSSLRGDQRLRVGEV